MYFETHLQQPGDEQMENETDEQFEERVLNKRAAQMFISVRARLQKQDSIQLSDMTYRNNRKQVYFLFISAITKKKQNKIKKINFRNFF